MSGAGTYRAGVWPVSFVVVSFWLLVFGVGSKGTQLVGASAVEGGGGRGRSMVEGGGGGGWERGDGGGWGRGGGGGGGGQHGGRAEGLELGSGGGGGGVGSFAWVPSTCVETVSIPNV